MKDGATEKDGATDGRDVMRSVVARGVSLAFGALQALDGVDLELGSGRISLLVGPNGAGKSTLMKVLLGLLKPDAGSLEIDGRPAPIDRVWKSKIGYLPEAVAFSENLSGQQVLRFFALARGVPRSRAREVLAQVGLDHARRRRVREYSRGMRQRLGLGVAILSTPELLILDEPTSGLDQKGLEVLWQVLGEWRTAGRLVLVSSHDLSLMERRIDDVCILRAGRVVACGSKEALRRRAALPHRVWLEVEGSEEGRIEALRTALEKWGRGRVERHPDRIGVEVGADAILELMELQGRFADAVRGLRVEAPTLDLVYEALLGTNAMETSE
jgi:Cu-processing system ATP-binding protein